MSARRSIRGALALAAALSAATATLVPAAGPGDGVAAMPALKASCPPSQTSGAHDYHGLVLVKCNFNGLDLTKANFAGATLTGVVFIRAKLAGANFSHATFADSGNSAFPNDFSLADLTEATFQKAQFNGPTYLTYATLTSADFSNIDLSNGNAIFGQTLRFDRDKQPRLSFANSTMNCEFVPQWAAMNLSGALGLGACAAQLAGFNFSNAMLSGADLSGIDLRKSRWDGAQLSGTNFQDSDLDGALGMSGAAQTVLKGALFNRASVRYVDFSGGKLYGASFIRADLEGSDFTKTALLADPDAANGTAGSFDYAHLKNVSLAGASLNSVSFTYASLYGTALGAPSANCLLANSGTPGKPACTSAAPRTGGTCSCATVSGADLTDANFSKAFLYGVDFSTGTQVNATRFDGAILMAANFADAKFTIDQTNGGKAPTFNGAWLHGVSASGLGKSALTGAFVDFGVTTNGLLRTSNTMHVLLSADYTRFRNWNGASTTPCLRLRYDKASVLPPDVGTMICPNGLSYPDKGCGALASKGDPATPLNPAWNGGAVVKSQPPGWYQRDSTYEPATTSSLGNAATASNVCNGQPQDRTWFSVSPPP